MWRDQIDANISKVKQYRAAKKKRRKKKPRANGLSKAKATAKPDDASKQTEPKPGGISPGCIVEVDGGGGAWGRATVVIVIVANL